MTIAPALPVVGLGPRHEREPVMGIVEVALARPSVKAQPVVSVCIAGLEK